MDLDELIGAMCEPTKAEPRLSPEFEGVDHINAYSKSTLEIGRLLSNFAHTPFTLPDQGTFASVEAYWYWLGCNDHAGRDDLRSLHGAQAKKEGRMMREIAGQRLVPDFETQIKRALEAKIQQNERVRDLLLGTDLPIVHYYATPKGVTQVPRGSQWVWSHLEKIRTDLQGK